MILRERPRWWDGALWWRSYTEGGYDGWRTIGGRKLPCATLDTAIRRPDMRDEIRRLARGSRGMRAWLHRKGIARVVNSGRADARVEARGPRPLAAWLARWAVRHTGYIRPDWQTVRVAAVTQEGRWHWKFQITYRRTHA